MLSSLTIKNYALIESLDIRFDDGFTAITGETGAGKSILLGALALVLGKRADLTLLRDKSRKCIIEADFVISNLELLPYFEKHDLDYEERSTLRREILPSGKSRAFVNDTPVGLQVMKELSEKLIDIHSQQQTLLLGKSGFQLDLFDSFINRPKLYTEYRQAYRQYTILKKRLNQLQQEKEQAEKEEDFLRFQLEELETASDAITEYHTLKAQEKMLSHAEEITNSMGLSVNLLSENDLSALMQLAKVRESLGRVASFHAGIATLNRRIESIVIELKDIVREAETLSEDISFNPALAAEINEKLDAVYRLQHKHHVPTVQDLQRIQEELTLRLNQIESVDTELKKTRIAFEQSKKNAYDKAEKLSSTRKKQTAAFEKQVGELLKRLGMPHAQLRIKQEALPSLNEYGCDTISFLFTANKGSHPEEIAKIASGGELSRLMLSLKAMVQQSKLLPTIIFDEIDAGVSGEIAGKIGTILQKMAQHLQVIVITHLPQIAAKAKYQMKVYKETGNLNTTSKLTLLNAEERIVELAKLISDEKVTEAALQTAKGLLEKRG